MKFFSYNAYKIDNDRVDFIQSVLCSINYTHLVSFKVATQTITYNSTKFTIVWMLCTRGLKVLDKKNVE